jgi:transcriptional regulator with XRE-family HTH domain
MDIGTRLRQLRKAKQLSQGDLEERSGMVRCYISRIENGHTIPSVETLAKWARALDLELYQVFWEGEGELEAVRVEERRNGLTPAESKLLDALRQIREPDRKLVLSLARYLRGAHHRRN